MKLYSNLGFILLKLEDKFIGNELIISLTGGEEHIGAISFTEYNNYNKCCNTTINYIKKKHKEGIITNYGSYIISNKL